MKKTFMVAWLLIAAMLVSFCMPALADEDANSSEDATVTSEEVQTEEEEFVPAFPMVEDFTGGYVPNPDCYVGPYLYEDETIRVEIKQTFAYDSIVWLVYVKIADPSQLRTTTAYYSIGAGRALPSRMAKTVNAVIAINGDFYSYRDGSYIVRQGKRLRNDPARNQDQLVIDFDGNFHIITERDKYYPLKELRSETYQAFTFGPALVVDGEVQDVSEYFFETMELNPRQAIGQLGELEYLLVCVDGRIPESAGITTQNLAHYMKELGCYQAFNLDGGGSAAVVWKGEKINFSAEPERIVGDIVYFVTAVPNEEAAE